MFWNSSFILLGHLVPSKWSFLRLSSSLLLYCSLFSILGGALSLLCLISSFCLVSPSTLIIRVQICSSIWFEELWSIERAKTFCNRLKHWFQICPSHKRRQTNDAWNRQYVICPTESTSSLDAYKIKERIQWRKHQWGVFLKPSNDKVRISAYILCIDSSFWCTLANEMNCPFYRWFE